MGPLLALYFGARYALLRSLRERADRAERERYLLAEQARTEERARLAGLRQRVELVHGTLRAGPARDGGFCLEATLPAYVPTAEPVA